TWYDPTATSAIAPARYDARRSSATSGGSSSRRQPERSARGQPLQRLGEAAGVERLADRRDVVDRGAGERAHGLVDRREEALPDLGILRRQRRPQRVARGKRGERRVRLGLVPVRNRGVVVREVVGVAVLEGPAQAAREADRVVHKPAIGAHET